MPLHEFVLILRRRWALIVAVVLVFVAVAAYSSFRATRLYRASAQIYFSLPNGNTATDLQQGSTYTQNQILTYAQMAKMPIVLDPAGKDLEAKGLQVGGLAGKVSAAAT